jgi:hypothetical protein
LPNSFFVSVRTKRIAVSWVVTSFSRVETDLRLWWF